MIRSREALGAGLASRAGTGAGIGETDAKASVSLLVQPVNTTIAAITNDTIAVGLMKRFTRTPFSENARVFIGRVSQKTTIDLYKL